MHNSKSLYPLVIPLILIALFTPSLWAQKDADATQIMTRVRSALNRIKPFQVNFTQQVFTDEQMDLQESGDILFNNDRQLKWTYRDPDFKVFLLEGEKYTFYDEDNEQVYIGTVKEKNKQWIWQLLFADDILPNAKWDRQQKTVFVKDKDRSLDIQITIDNQDLPVKVIQTDPSGVRMIYLFDHYKPEINVTPDTFKLDVPQDVEVIRE